MQVGFAESAAHCLAIARKKTFQWRLTMHIEHASNRNELKTKYIVVKMFPSHLVAPCCQIIWLPTHFLKVTYGSQVDESQVVNCVKTVCLILPHIASYFPLPHIAHCLILPHIATIVTRWQWLLMIYSSKFLWGNMTQIRAHCTNSEHVKTVCLILIIALHWWGSTCLNKLHQGLCTNTEQAWSDFKLWFWKSLRANNHDRVGWSGDVVQAPPDFRSNDCQVSSSESPRDKNRAHNLDWPPLVPYTEDWGLCFKCQNKKVLQCFTLWARAGNKKDATKINFLCSCSIS